MRRMRDIGPVLIRGTDLARFCPPLAVSYLTSRDSPFAAAYNEVKVLGRFDSAARSPDQTQIAFFWEDGPGSATPPGHWQIIAQEFAARFGTTLAENARLFALLSIAQA